MYAVGSHVPGYLPDTEPWTTDNFGTAVEMMIEEVERAVEDDFEEMSASAILTIEAKIANTRKHVSRIDSCDVVEMRVGGRRYYVERM